MLPQLPPKYSQKRPLHQLRSRQIDKSNQHGSYTIDDSVMLIKTGYKNENHHHTQDRVVY